MSAGDYQGTYAAEKVVITVGPVIVTGFTDGDFVTVKYDEDRYTHKAGADGEVGRAKTASRAGTVEITLSATSLANDELSTLFNLAQVGGIDPPIPVGVADLSGRSLAGAAKAWIKTAPDMTFGKDVGERVWTLQGAGLFINYGGNS
jgi:hypothetical protein